MAGRLPVPDDADPRRVLGRQVELMLKLADEALDGVSLEDCLWTIDDTAWTVHERDGRWFGELGDETPEMAMPSLAWTMWHPIWWLRTLLAHVDGVEPPRPEDVAWPGPLGALPEIRDLCERWLAHLDSLDDAALASPSPMPWPYDDDRPLVHVAGWVSMELIKNLAEMCALCRARADAHRRSV